MQLFDPKNPNEKKKMIAAAVLGVAALAVLAYVFFGGGSSTKPSTNKIITNASPAPGKISSEPQTPIDDPSMYQPVFYNNTVAAVSEGDRNIFAYYEPPPTPVKVPYVPTPTPAPTPPLMITSMMPANVFAGTPADFSLQIMGDQLTPGLKISIDGRDLPTRFINAQQLFTTVPKILIANPGSRQVMVKSNDGKFYSNTISLNVSPAPTPNFNYIGVIGKPHYNDIAVLQDKNSKELINVVRGDVVGGRFRVSSISEKEIVFIDTSLKIRTPIAFTADPANGPQFRPPVRVSEEEPN
jgi:hypothetical protein